MTRPASDAVPIPAVDAPKKNSPSSLWQILGYIRPHKWPFIWTIFLSVLQALTYLLLPIFASIAIDQMAAKDFNGMLMTFAWLFVSILANALVTWRKMWTNRLIGNRIIRTMRNDLMLKMQKQNYSWLDSHPTGDLMSRTTSDVNLLKTFMAQDIAFFMMQSLMIGLSFGVMFWFNVSLGLWQIPFLLVLFLLMFYYRAKIRPLFFASRETFGQLTTVLQENITGMRVVRSFGRKKEEIRKFDAKNDVYFDQSMKLVKYQSLFDPSIRGINMLRTVIVIFMGGAMSLDPSTEMTFGKLFGFVLIMQFSTDPLRFITQFLGDLSKVRGACDRITEVLDAKSPIVELPNASNIQLNGGVVECRDVWFSFYKNQHYELKKINFRTKPGEIIAILGATGSGKSALVNLVPRLYEFDQGEILIDGKSIREFTLQSLRRQVAVVAQENFLFSESLRNNIALSDLTRASDIEWIRHCAKLAQIDDWIMSLEKGYDTIIGERGVTVSGGQRQRICIARALFIRPRILILDDATSSVDVDTEYEIQKGFSDMFKGTTTFIITQRLSTVRYADRILVLQNGEIAEDGTHESLLEKNGGIYNKIYNTLKIEERSK